MMTNSNLSSTDEIATLKMRLRDLIKTNDVLDASTGWLHLYKLLFSAEVRVEYVGIIKDYLSALFPDESVMVVIPDIVAADYNLLPAAFVAAYERRDDIAIWAEVGNIVSGLPILFHDPNSRHTTCVVVQDIIETGATMRKILPDIKAAGWQIRGIVALIEGLSEKNEFKLVLDQIQSEDLASTDFMYYGLLKLSELYK